MSWARRLALGLVVLGLAFPCLGAPGALPKLRFSLPAMMSCLPIAFGESWGLFEKHGVDVELVGLSDNDERSAALLAGTIDGMICDVTAAVLLLAAGNDVLITSVAHGGDQTGSLALLSPKSYRIDSIEALYATGRQGFKVATIYRSDLEFETDQLMKSLGYPVGDADLYSYYPDMLQLAVYFAALMVPAAVLPEPYTTYISHLTDLKTLELLEFAHLSDFEGITPLPGVMVFRSEVVEEKQDAVARFYDAYREAIAKVNATSREELIQSGIGVAISIFFPGVNPDTVPPAMLDNFVIPQFEETGPLDPQQFTDVVAWVNLKRYAVCHLAYAAVTTNQFLP